MLSLSVAESLRRVLAIGCHADDIEIGCGGTLLTLARANPELEVDWVVLAAQGGRADEARASAEAFLAGAATSRVEVFGFRDGFLPYVGSEVKDVFEELKARVEPQLVLHARGLRLPPGPPARVRADVEHVPEPCDPRVRDPEGRRRPWPAELVRPALRGGRRGETRPARAAFPKPGRQALVRSRDVPRADATSWHGSGRP